MAALRRRPTVSAGASARPDVRRDVEDDIEAPRLLCLHCWLDNAASFVPLMAHLPSVDIVALDLPGHGASDWLDAGYAFAETVYRLRRVLQQLGWTRCHVAGHSLGGCIAPQLAIAAPDTVASLLLIEASGPLSEEADALPNRLRRALEERLDLDRFVSRTYPDPEAAVAARLRAARMAPASARLIIDRQLRPCEGGWQWRFDPRLRVASSAYLTEAQVRAVLAAVTCPTLTFIATDGFLAARDDTEARLGELRSRTSVTLPGNHQRCGGFSESDRVREVPALGRPERTRLGRPMLVRTIRACKSPSLPCSSTPIDAPVIRRSRCVIAGRRSCRRSDADAH